MASKAEDGNNNTNPTSNDDLKRREKIRGLIDNVAIRLQAGIENGLFKQKGVKTNGSNWVDIQKLISEARGNLNKNIDDAENKQEEALNQYFNSINHAGAKWRFSQLYAGPIWIFLIGTLVGIYIFYVSGMEKQLIDQNNYFSLKISSAAI